MQCSACGVGYIDQRRGFVLGELISGGSTAVGAWHSPPPDAAGSNAHLSWDHICKKSPVSAGPLTSVSSASHLLVCPLAPDQAQGDGGLSCRGWSEKALGDNEKKNTRVPARDVPQPPSPHTVMVILLFSSIVHALFVGPLARQQRRESWECWRRGRERGWGVFGCAQLGAWLRAAIRKEGAGSPMTGIGGGGVNSSVSVLGRGVQ